MSDFLQYIDMDSFLHKLDPRTKFAFFIVMSILTSFIKSGVALLFLLAVFIVIWHFSHIGKYMLTLLFKIKALLLFIFLLWLVLGMFSVNVGPALYRTTFELFGSARNFSLDWFDFYKGSVFAIRIFLMISAFYTVILSTNFSQIILGLRSWNVPYAISFGIGLIFQIIPMIISEFATIMEAQSSRGLEIEKCSALTKMKNYVIVSLPLLFRVLGKGHAISLSMHYYKLDFKVKRTSYKSIQSSYLDGIFAAVTAAATAVTVFLHFMYNIPL